MRAAPTPSARDQRRGLTRNAAAAPVRRTAPGGVLASGDVQSQNVPADEGGDDEEKGHRRGQAQEQAHPGGGAGAAGTLPPGGRPRQGEGPCPQGQQRGDLERHGDPLEQGGAVGRGDEGGDDERRTQGRERSRVREEDGDEPGDERGRESEKGGNGAGGGDDGGQRPVCPRGRRRRRQTLVDSVESALGRLAFAGREGEGPGRAGAVGGDEVVTLPATRPEAQLDQLRVGERARAPRGRPQGSRLSGRVLRDALQPVGLILLENEPLPGRLAGETDWGARGREQRGPLVRGSAGKLRPLVRSSSQGTQTAGQARMGLPPLVLRVQTPWKEGELVQLHQPPGQGGGIAAQLGSASVAVGLVGLVAGQAHHQGEAHRQGPAGGHREGGGVEPSQDRRGPERREEDHRRLHHAQADDPPAIEVLEVGLLVSEDRRDLVDLEHLQQRWCERHRRLARGGKREAVRPSSPGWPDHEEAGHGGGGARGDGGQSGLEVGTVQGRGLEQPQQDPVVENAPGQQESGEPRRHGPLPRAGPGDEPGCGHDEHPETCETHHRPHDVDEVGGKAPRFPEQCTSDGEASGQEGQEEKWKRPRQLRCEDDKEEGRAGGGGRDGPPAPGVHPLRQRGVPGEAYEPETPQPDEQPGSEGHESGQRRGHGSRDPVPRPPSRARVLHPAAWYTWGRRRSRPGSPARLAPTPRARIRASSERGGVR